MNIKTAQEQIDLLLQYVVTDDHQKIKLSLVAGFDVNYQNQQGWTLLIAACRHDKINCVRLLLDFGANPGLSNFNGTTPLMYAKTAAFASGKTASMDLLLKAGADPLALDNCGLSALDYTRQRAKFLIEYLQNKEDKA